MAKDYDKRTSVEVPLNYPVTVDAETFNSLTVRRAKVSDQLKATKAFPDDETARGIRISALLCGVADDVIAELDMIDFNALGAQVSAFTGQPSAAAK